MVQQQQKRTDWRILAFHQECENEPLQCSTDSKSTEIVTGYTIFATNIECFKAK